MRTKPEKTAAAGPMGTESPDKSPAAVHESFRPSVRRQICRMEVEMALNGSVMPDRTNLGSAMASTMAHCMGQYRQWKEGGIETHGHRTAMGFVLPSWQRGLVWTEGQKIAFIESAWRGIPLGTYTYNEAPIGSPFDYLLIDGQQRMSAIQAYVEGEFRVFGYRWSELPAIDGRRWSMSTAFPCFITKTEDEEYLRSYYNIMNFGGTAHKGSERA